MYRSGNENIDCDLCEESNINMHKFFYRCEPCSLNICRACCYTISDSLRDQERFKIHTKCLMTKNYANYSNDWSCNNTQRLCKSGSTEKANKNVQSYKCIDCDVFVCLDCC